MPALEIIALDTTTPQLRAPSAADTYTAPRAMDITPVALTGSAATSSLSIAQTWNTTGTPTAIDLNVTDTASNASSLLMNLRVGGTSQFRVSKAGVTTTNGALAIGGSATIGGNVNLPTTANTLNWAGSIVLTGDAANTLAQRNGVNAQAFRVYNTFTDASNYERLEVSWASNVVSIGPIAAGTGAVRSMQFSSGGTGRWTLTTSGHLLANADNTYDIGASGANRPRDIYTAGRIDIGNGNLTLSNDVRLSRRASGVLLLDNNGGTDFGRLQFGGTTSSFPALKRNGTTLETKLADDSGFAPHAAEWLSVTDGVTAPGAAAGRARIYVDSADGDLKVVFADGTVKTIVTDT